MLYKDFVLMDFLPTELISVEDIFYNSDLTIVVRNLEYQGNWELHMLCAQDQNRCQILVTETSTTKKREKTKPSCRREMYNVKVTEILMKWKEDSVERQVSGRINKSNVSKKEQPWSMCVVFGSLFSLLFIAFFIFEFCLPRGQGVK